MGSIRYTGPSELGSLDVPFSIISPVGAAGIFYAGGFYLLGSTSYTPAGGTTLGSSNAAYGAHAFIVLGASSADMVVRITGTSIDDLGNRTASDTQDLDTSGGSLDDYFETTKKWIGQISFSLQSGTGVAINDGLCKYWDNQNTNFRLTGIEVTGHAGASDSAPNFEVLYHRATGWTFNSGAPVTTPPPLEDMQTDYNTEFAFVFREPFAWKRVGLNTKIAGGSGEGLIGRVVTTSAKAIEYANWIYSIRQG